MKKDPKYFYINKVSFGFIDKLESWDSRKGPAFFSIFNLYENNLISIFQDYSRLLESALSRLSFDHIICFIYRGHSF